MLPYFKFDSSYSPGDRVLWRTLGEAYVQQWTAIGDDGDDDTNNY